MEETPLKLNFDKEFPRKVHLKSDIIFLRNQFPEHPLSVEEQQLFLKLTENIFGYNEVLRNASLKRLAGDNIARLTPYLSVFLKETIMRNIVTTDLTLLIYSVRMAKSLLSNPNINNLKEHIHLILPAIISCVITKKISKYQHDNHWTLRDFSAYVVAMICHLFNNNLNKITERVINLYLEAILNEDKALTTLYGGLKGLASMGEDIVKVYLIPNIIFLNSRLVEGNTSNPQEKQRNFEVKQVRNLVLGTAGPILFKTKNVDDDGVLYCNKFGYLGKFLYYYVKSLEQA